MLVYVYVQFCMHYMYRIPFQPITGYSKTYFVKKSDIFLYKSKK